MSAETFSFPRLTLQQRWHGWNDVVVGKLLHRPYAKVTAFAYSGDLDTACPRCGEGMLVDAERNLTCLVERGPDFPRGCGHTEPVAHRLVDTSPAYYNLVVTVGKALMLQRLFALSSSVALTSIGVGTDSTAAAVGQTQLNPSVAGSVLIQTNDAGTALSSGTINGFASGTTVTAQSTFGTGVANFSWNECSQHNGNVNGTSTMFDRIAPIGPFAKTSSVSIVLQISTTQS